MVATHELELQVANLKKLRSTLERVKDRFATRVTAVSTQHYHRTD